MRLATLVIVLALSCLVAEAYPTAQVLSRYRAPMTPIGKEDNETHMTPCDFQPIMCEAHSCLEQCYREHDRRHVGSYCKSKECICVHK